MRKRFELKGIYCLVNLSFSPRRIPSLWAATCFFARAHMNTINPMEQKNSPAWTRDAMAVVLGVVIGVAAVSVGCRSCTSAPKGDGKNPQTAIKTILHLEPFVVNLADPEDNRFLRVGLDLGLDVALAGKGGKGGEGELPTARIRDCILEVLSSWRSDALLAPEGKEKLKGQLIQALHARAPEVGVKEIYFTDFLVQR